MKIKNSQGRVWYGLHFYPGVAEYQEPGKQAFRVFLNEDTIRNMGPSFAARPVFVQHVDDVNQDVDVLKAEADGWVVESFFNEADGKHWAKFITVSERAEEVIKRGWRLSNSYFPKQFGKGGVWNGVTYDKEVTGGEYEHLALVPNPRYEDQPQVMTPEQFKAYNEEKTLELKRLANAKKENKGMAWKLFKRTKVENSGLDLAGVSVYLEKAKKEVTIEELITEADERLSNSPMAAHPEHLVDMGEGQKMTVNDMLSKYKASCNEIAEMKKNAAEKEKETELDEDEKDVEVEGDLHNDDDDTARVDTDDAVVASSADEDGGVKERKKNAADDKKKEDELETARKKKEAKEKAERLRNAGPTAKDEDEPKIEFARDQVARGKQRYGSN